MTRYTVAAEAQADLDQIWDYVAQHNASAGDRLIDRFHEQFSLLASQPRMGRARPELAPHLRQVVLGSYLILYRPTGDGVRVVRIIHGARRIEGFFGEGGREPDA